MGRGFLSLRGREGETAFPIEGVLFIGSAAGCEIRVADAAPRHCQVSRTPEGYAVRDLTGQRLVTVNGARVDRHLLREGDVLKVGSEEFSFDVAEGFEASGTGSDREARPAPQRRMAGPRTGRIKRAEPGKPLPKIAIAAAGALLLLAASALIMLLWGGTSSPREATKAVASKPTGAGPTAKPASMGAPGDAPRPLSERPAEAAQVGIPGGPGETPAERPAPAEILPRLDAPAPLKPLEPSPGAERGQGIPPGGALESWKQEILRYYNHPDKVDPATEAAARNSPSFGLRYAALLLQLHRALARGSGYEAAHRALFEASPEGGPRGAAEHLKALAASLKEAVCCKECKNGKVTCAACQGKGKVDLNCPVCDGRGRVRPLGAVGDTDVTTKCRNCDGQRVFRGVTCSVCSRTGQATCAVCRGRPWPDGRCSSAACKDGRVPCPQCQGKGWELLKCPFCENGRFRASGAVNGAEVTVKCRNCEVDGKHGNGTLRQDCKICRKTGKITCDACGGVFAAKPEAKPPVTSAAAIYSLDRCGACPGADGPSLCPKCLGLGVRIKPATDPAKVLD